MNNLKAADNCVHGLLHTVYNPISYLASRRAEMRVMEGMESLDQSLLSAILRGELEDGYYRVEIPLDGEDRVLRSWINIENSKLNSVFVKIVSSNGDLEYISNDNDVKYMLVKILATPLMHVQRIEFRLRAASWIKVSEKDILFAMRVLSLSLGPASA